MRRVFVCFLCLLVLVSMLLTSCADAEAVRTRPSTGGKDGESAGEENGDASDTDDSGEETDLPRVENCSVYVNEVCTKSTDRTRGCLDWIELYNAGEERVELGGWRLSDSSQKPAKYVFPQGTVLEAGDYLLIWASGTEAPAAGLPFASYYAPFRLSNDGETLYLSTPDGLYADVVEIPALEPDKTWGRTYDGAEYFALLSGTPAASNDGTVETLADSVMTFSHESGFYEDAFDLEISVPDGYTVRYTVDCTDPAVPGSGVKNYTGAIRVTDPTGAPTYSLEHFTGKNSDLSEVEKCFVVRAVAKDPQGHSTKTVTKNYFVGLSDRPAYGRLPVLTLTTSPDEIYGSENGLFPNYDRGKLEKQVNFMLFDRSGAYSFDQEVGIRIRGSSTRDALQKNLNVYARSKYGGASVFPDTLFPDAAFTKSLVLRSDNRWNLQLGQDFLQDLVKDRDVCTQDSFPLIVFIDGEYFGIYNLYERFSEDFVEAHYGVDKDDVYTVKNASEANSEEALTAYSEMYSLLTSGDLTDAAVYERLCGMVDMQSLIDLYCIQMYLDNGDFSMQQNITAWRAAPAALDPDNPYADGKWRFVLYDLDYAMDGPAQTSEAWKRDTFSVTPKNSKLGDPFLRWASVINLMKNQTFKNRFVTSFMDIVNVNYHYQSRVKDVMEARVELLYPCVLPYLRRFNYKNSGGTVRAASAWSSRLKEKQIAFMENRADVIVGYMAQHFGLTDAPVTLTVSSRGAVGGVTLNGLTAIPFSAEGTWSGSYYALTYTATATPPDGYVFVGWSATGGVGISGSGQTISFTLTGEGTLQAEFAPA